MPQWIEDRVKELLDNPEFGKNLKGEKRKSMAYAVATKQYKEKFSKHHLLNKFDIICDFTIITNSVISASDYVTEAEIKGYDKFDKIKPISENSMLVQMSIQGEFIQKVYNKQGLLIPMETFDKALPTLAKEPNNNLYADHIYDAEHTIGTVHAIDVPTRTAVVEIFQSPVDRIGLIVAENIRTGRTKGASTGFRLKKTTCGICGAVGHPYLPCDHIAGWKYNKKVNMVTVNEIRYFDLSAVSYPKDADAVLIRHNSVIAMVNNINYSGNLDSIDNDDSIEDDNTQETLKKDIQKRDNQHIINKTQMKKMSENNELDELVKQNKIIQEEINTLKNTLRNQNSEIDQLKLQKDSLQERNVVLQNFIEEEKVKRKGDVARKIIDIKIQLGLITNDDRENEIMNLSSLSEEYLKQELDEKNKLLSIFKGKIATNTINPIDPTNSKVPPIPSNIQRQLDKSNALKASNQKLDVILQAFQGKPEKKVKGGFPFPTHKNPILVFNSIESESREIITDINPGEPVPGISYNEDA